MQHKLFDKRGGYRRLHSFTYATMIHLETINFCKRFVPWQEDQLGKTAGQMIGAARSGRQNIIEGSERAATSKETEIKLTDVARASLAELLGDLEIYLAEHKSIPWSKGDPNRQKLSAILLPDFEHTDDNQHDYWIYYHRVRSMFAEWFDNTESIVVANSLIILIHRTMAMLNNQITKMGDAFLEEGGFREKMYQSRVEVRELQDEGSPTCPECGKAMKKRTAHNGKNKGKPFWGCSGYPDCHGTRPVDG